ncbi:MAG: YoaK family protein [Agathobacter sp.]|nr:YoaK family protein [uncultured Agathobacter sp.]MEE1032980.1 YoaK family protein [Agathobacter sp.]
MHKVKIEKNKIQTSETFVLSAILAMSGGFQDAYTYNVRKEVFSNAQTGNIVLMSQHIMMGELMKGLSYLFPVVAFALGVLVAERIGHRYKGAKRIHWRQIIVAIEIVILFAVGFIPERYDMLATMLVSFSCSMQVQAFRKVNGYGYASTMCIGNLRSGTESLSIYLREKQHGALKKAAHYYGIIFIFAIGAGIGGICSLHIGIRAIWISSILLAIVCAMMIKEHR